MSDKKSKKVSALVLQGGGALGAYEYGVVKALFEKGDFKPEIICGVSIGAISAATLVGAKDGPVNGLDELWKLLTAKNMPLIPHDIQVMASMPYNSGMYYPNLKAMIAPLNATNMLNTAPLYKTLDTLIDFEKLNSKDAPKLVIGATNIETGLGELFDNKKMQISTDHIVASASFPPAFPMVEIDGNHYWDGGLFSNTPLKPAIQALEKYGPEYEKEVVVVQLFSQAGEVPTNMIGVMNRMMNMMGESKFNFDKNLFQRTNDYIDLAQMLDTELDNDNPIRSHPALSQLLKYTKIDNIISIAYDGDESMMGVSDFTEQSVNKRIEIGYQDGLSHIPTINQAHS